MRLVSLIAAAALAGCAASALGRAGATAGFAATAGVAVRAKDSFAGQISSATGRYKHDHGRLSATVSVPDNAATARALILRLSGKPCRPAKSCLELSGTLEGTLTKLSQQVADVGASFSIEAGGKVTGLGHVSATGTLHGTGFIARGRETMALTLVARSGHVSVSLVSQVVPGFTSP